MPFRKKKRKIEFISGDTFFDLSKGLARLTKLFELLKEFSETLRWSIPRLQEPNELITERHPRKVELHWYPTNAQLIYTDITDDEFETLKYIFRHYWGELDSYIRGLTE